MVSLLPLPRRAWILAVGSELLTPFRADTNSLYLTSKLNDVGIEVVGKAIVGDRPAELAAVIVETLARTDMLVLTGGLGPTEDDVTRQAVAAALGLPLDEDEAIVEQIQRRFARRQMEMPAVNRVQSRCCVAPSSCRIRTAPRRGSGWNTPARRSCCCPARRARCGR